MASEKERRTSARIQEEFGTSGEITSSSKMATGPCSSPGETTQPAARGSALPPPVASQDGRLGEREIMFHELILVCMSISVVVTTLPELKLATGSQDCVQHPTCKSSPYGRSDNYVFKVPGSNQDVQTTVCEALSVHYNRWVNEEQIIRITWVVLQNITDTIEVVNNTTSEVLVLLNTL